jgi:hypothetical protein
VAKRAVKSKERSQSQEGEEKEGGGKLTMPTSEGLTLATLPVVREALSVFMFAVCSWLRNRSHCLGFESLLLRRRKTKRCKKENFLPNYEWALLTLLPSFILCLEVIWILV